MNERLLVVDDSPQELKLLTIAFESQHYDVQAVLSGEEALRLVRTWQPDLVLLDVRMPILDGYETARHLQSFEGTRDVPIMMLTAMSNAEDDSLASGAVDFVTKPFDLDSLRRRVRAHLDYYKRVKRSKEYVPERVIELPPMMTRRRGRLLRAVYYASKRAFDFTLGTIMLVAFLPVFLAVAIAIRLESPGPIVFVQQRTGYNGKRFKMYKFRTMVANAEELKEKYRHLNEMTWPDFKITNDPRVTRIGRFLRKTSLDELPQLWNIVTGSMSFVGPRPTSFKAETYQLWHTERLEAKPGLTGLWQIGGRADVDFDERVELDIEYIERQSWGLDMRILFATAGAVFTGRGAH